MLKSTMNNIKISGKNSGYSLVELLVYIALFILIALTIAEVFSMITQVNNRIVSAVELNSSAAEAMERMMYEIKNSDHIYTPTSNFMNYNYDAVKASQLSLATGQSPQAGESLAYVDFYLQNNTIFIKTEGSPGPVAITTPAISVQSLQFFYYKNGSKESVEIDFTAIPSNALDSGMTIHINTVVALRS